MAKRGYFGKATEDAIFRWQQAPTQSQKDVIFTNEIYPVFNILAEKLIHKFKFYPDHMTLAEVRANIVTHLYEKGLPKIKQVKGKAFSYCTRTSINYILAKRREYHNKKIKKTDVTEIDNSRDIYTEIHAQNYQDDLSLFIDLWVDWYDTNLYNLYSKEKSIKIVDAVLDLFRARRNIEIFQKKSLYILIRERSGCNTNEITPVIKKIKAHFKDMYTTYKTENKLEL